MDLDSVQVKESRIDRNKRYMVEGRCFNCSEKGHVTADCPRKPDRTPRPAARIHLTTLKRKEQETLPKQQDEDSEGSSGNKSDSDYFLPAKSLIDKCPYSISQRDGTAYLEPHDTVELTGHVGKHKVVILCDNGATNFFVRRQFVEQLHCEVKPLACEVSLATKTPTIAVKSGGYVKLIYSFAGRREEAEFVVVDHLKYDLILGIPWYKWRRPKINYVKGTLSYRDGSGD